MVHLASCEKCMITYFLIIKHRKQLNYKLGYLHAIISTIKLLSFSKPQLKTGTMLFTFLCYNRYSHVTPLRVVSYTAGLSSDIMFFKR